MSILFFTTYCWSVADATLLWCRLIWSTLISFRSFKVPEKSHPSPCRVNLGSKASLSSGFKGRRSRADSSGARWPFFVSLQDYSPLLSNSLIVKPQPPVSIGELVKLGLCGTGNHKATSGILRDTSGLCPSALHLLAMMPPFCAYICSKHTGRSCAGSGRNMATFKYFPALWDRMSSA